MFNVEPQERWTVEEKAEFEEYVAEDLRKCIVAAGWAGGALLINILCIVPFLAGHFLHKYWESTKFLVYTAEGLLLWFVYKASAVWASWKSAKDTRKEYGDSI